jgi:hypothetical protein
MTLPTEYNEAYGALHDGLTADDTWQWQLSDHRNEWAGTAISSVLILSGTGAARYVEPWSDASTDRFGARVFTDDLLILVEVGALADDDRQVTVLGVPLTIELLEVTASVTPWDNTFGSTPAWPGNVSATVRIAGREPITIPPQPITNPEQREAVQRLVAHLAARLR